MPKVYYISEITKGIDQINFFKTEKEAQKHGKSAWVNTQFGLLMTWEEDRVYLQSADDEEARKFIRSSKHDKQGSAIFFDSFKKGMYGSLGNDFAEGEGYTWIHDGKGIVEVTEQNKISIMRQVKFFEEFVLEDDCKCGGNCTCTTNEAKADGTISDDEDELMDDLMGNIEAAIDDLIADSRDKAYEIGGSFRGPGNVDRIKKLLVAKVKKMKL